MIVIHSCIEYICTCLLLLLLYVSKRECATWKTSRSLTFCTSRSFTCFVVDSLTQTYLNIIVLVCVSVSVWWHPWGDTFASHKAWRIITLLFYNTYHRCHRRRRLPPFLTFSLMSPNSAKHCESKEKYTFVSNVLCFAISNSKNNNKWESIWLVQTCNYG